MPILLLYQPRCPFFTMRADQGARLADEDFRLLGQSGLRNLLVGVETGSTSVLKTLGKDITLEPAPVVGGPDPGGGALAVPQRPLWVSGGEDRDRAPPSAPAARLIAAFLAGAPKPAATFRWQPTESARTPG